MGDYKANHGYLYVILCIFFVITCIVGYFLQNIKKSGDIEFRYDLEPILRRYPNIDHIVNVAWYTDSFGSTTFGKNEYWIEGYMWLSTDLDEFNTLYDWEIVDSFEPGFSPKEISDDEIQWYHSDEFDEIYCGTIMFYSKFYYCPDDTVLYVYGETN